jgi:uncharacterized protein
VRRVKIPDISGALSETADGTVLAIEVSAGSKKAQFPAGYNPWREAVGCHVHAPPHEGKANRDVVSVIAEGFGIPSNRVQIVSGSRSSYKKVLIAGIGMESVKDYLLKFLDRN